jgi:hypothetical protein
MRRRTVSYWVASGEGSLRLLPVVVRKDVVEDAKRLRIGIERAPHSRDQIIPLIAGGRIVAPLVEHPVAFVLLQRFAAVLSPPLAGDAALHLGEEGWQWHVIRPRPASGQHAVERLIEQIVRIVVAQPPRPNAGQCRKTQEFRPAKSTDDAANLAGGKMRRLIVHWPPTKPLYKEPCAARREVGIRPKKKHRAEGKPEFIPAGGGLYQRIEREREPAAARGGIAGVPDQITFPI